jgi:hypothetical protein
MVFNAFAGDPDVRGFNETADDELYSDFRLRPGPAVSEVVAGVGGTVLLRQVHWPAADELRRVIASLSALDPTVIWLYRDPVANLSSAVDAGWWKPSPQRWMAEALRWRRDNRRALSLADAVAQFVRYEDLVEDPTVLDRLGEAVGVRPAAIVGGDRRGGARLGPVASALVRLATRRTSHRLDRARTMTVSDGGAATARRDEHGPRSVTPTSVPSTGVLAAIHRDALGDPPKVAPAGDAWRRLSELGDYTVVALVHPAARPAGRSGASGNLGPIVVSGRPFSGGGGFCLGWLYHSVEARAGGATDAAAVVAGIVDPSGRAPTSRSEQALGVLMPMPPGPGPCAVGVTHRVEGSDAVLHLVAVEVDRCRVVSTRAPRSSIPTDPDRLVVRQDPDRPGDRFEGDIWELRLYGECLPSEALAAILQDLLARRSLG